jgi:[ribosomal protein S5]-alanine N-acetyltransferase
VFSGEEALTEVTTERGEVEEWPTGRPNLPASCCACVTVAIIRRMSIRMGEFREVGGEEVQNLFPEATERLKLVPRTRRHSEVEAAGQAEMAKVLAAQIPKGWPPTLVAPPTNEAESWSNCYVVDASSAEGPILIGIAGAARWPAEKRTVQIGASVVSEYHGRRIGEEVVRALAEMALLQPDVDQVVCDIPADHVASGKSLERAGYVKSAVAPEQGYFRFVRSR